MLRIQLDAPFAVFRPYTAGWFRPTAKFLTPSAAFGLLLNLAGIETRLPEEDEAHDGKQPTTYMRSDLPAFRIALGVPEVEGRPAFPREQTIYQQLHNYPVGASGKERAADAHGCKYNITPVRRGFLAGLQAIIFVDAGAEIEDRIRRGLAGTLDVPRYGLPFLGDNSFLPDRLEPLSEDIPTFWYERLEGNGSPIRPHSTRLTIWIDRSDMSRTRSSLFAPASVSSPEPPGTAWVEVGPPAVM